MIALRQPLRNRIELGRDSVGAVVMGPYADLAEGMKVKCTGRITEVPVGRGLLGRVVNTGRTYRRQRPD